MRELRYLNQRKRWIGYPMRIIHSLVKTVHHFRVLNTLLIGDRC